MHHYMYHHVQSLYPSNLYLQKSVEEYLTYVQYKDCVGAAAESNDAATLKVGACDGGLLYTWAKSRKEFTVEYFAFSFFFLPFFVFKI